MSETSHRAVAAGCLGTLTGAAVGGVLGGFVAQALGFRTTGSVFFLALDLVVYFCVGGGAILGAIAGREIAYALARFSRRGPANPAENTAGGREPTDSEAPPDRQA